MSNENDIDVPTMLGVRPTAQLYKRFKAFKEKISLEERSGCYIRNQDALAIALSRHFDSIGIPLFTDDQPSPYVVP